MKDGVDKFINEMHDHNQISDKMRAYLLDGGRQIPIFYMLPKIHKDWEKPPGRPIVSSVDSPTEGISQLVDIILQPYAQGGKSFILDTTDFIKKIKGIKLDADEWLFTLDITSLYTNIPHQEGLSTVESVLSTYKGTPNKTYILRMLSMVLKCNCFCYDSDLYLQVNGMAMGTKVAPTYAVIFMNLFEEKHVYSYKKPPKIWFRFIDDIWGIYKGSEEELLLFLSHLNEVHSSIKFTFTYSKEEVIFLDVITKVDISGSIYTTLYVKPTDSHGYLDFGSYHPLHSKNSIPYSQMLRIRRNCDKWSDFMINCIKLTTYLSRRGYPWDLIKDSFLRVKKLTQQSTLIKPENRVSNDLFFILDFNTFIPKDEGYCRSLLENFG